MSNTANVSQLFKSALATGDLSVQAAKVLNTPDLGAEIQAGLGVKPDDVPASEVTLVSFLIDDSGSIRFANNAQLVRDGHNLVVGALQGSKQSNGILTYNRYLNGTQLYPYVPVDQAIEMTNKNYDPNGGTPLYDETVVILGTVVAKRQEFEDAGVPVRCITLIISDGADAGSHRQSAMSVRTVVGDMLRSERHVVAAMGIDDGGQTDFRAVFQEMGIRDEWILTPGNSKSEIRKAFLLFSQSAVRVSQGATLGGFGTP